MRVALPPEHPDVAHDSKGAPAGAAHINNLERFRPYRDPLPIGTYELLQLLKAAAPRKPLIMKLSFILVGGSSNWKPTSQIEPVPDVGRFSYRASNQESVHVYAIR